MVFKLHLPCLASSLNRGKRRAIFAFADVVHSLAADLKIVRYCGDACSSQSLDDERRGLGSDFIQWS